MEHRFVSTTIIMQATRRQNSDADTAIRHLRSQGSYLYKLSTSQHLVSVAAQGDVAEIADDRVTEAYGVDNWPHLLHALDEGDDVLKVRVLTAMTTLFRLPQPVVMCVKHGIFELLEQGIVGTNPDIQRLSAHVLSVLLETSCGRSEFMSNETATIILPVFAAASDVNTTRFLYDATISFSRSFACARILTGCGYLPAVMEHLRRELPSDTLVVRALTLLKLIVNDGIESTAFKALEMSAMRLCHCQLGAADPIVRVAACDAIAALCCVDKAKKLAVEVGCVKLLCGLLNDKSWHVQAASSAALTTIAIHDEAKRAVVACDGLPSLLRLLGSSKMAVQLHTVKLITVLAAYPPAREILNVGATDFHLSTLAQDPDALLAKCAKLALRAIHWTP